MTGRERSVACVSEIESLYIVYHYTCSVIILIRKINEKIYIHVLISAFQEDGINIQGSDNDWLIAV